MIPRKNSGYEQQIEAVYAKGSTYLAFVYCDGQLEAHDKSHPRILRDYFGLTPASAGDRAVPGLVRLDEDGQGVATFFSYSTEVNPDVEMQDAALEALEEQFARRFDVTTYDELWQEEDDAHTHAKEGGVQPVELMLGPDDDYEWFKRVPLRAGRFAFVYQDGTLYCGRTHRTLIRAMRLEGMDAMTNSVFGWIQSTPYDMAEMNGVQFDGYDLWTDNGNQTPELFDEVHAFFAQHPVEAVLDYLRNGTRLSKTAFFEWGHSYLYLPEHGFLIGGWAENHRKVMQANNIQPHELDGQPFAAGIISIDFNLDGAINIEPVHSDYVETLHYEQRLDKDDRPVAEGELFAAAKRAAYEWARVNYPGKPIYVSSDDVGAVSLDRTDPEMLAKVGSIEFVDTSVEENEHYGGLPFFYVVGEHQEDRLFVGTTQSFHKSLLRGNEELYSLLRPEEYQGTDFYGLIPGRIDREGTVQFYQVPAADDWNVSRALAMLKEAWPQIVANEELSAGERFGHPDWDLLTGEGRDNNNPLMFKIAADLPKVMRVKTPRTKLRGVYGMPFSYFPQYDTIMLADSHTFHTRMWPKLPREFYDLVRTERGTMVNGHIVPVEGGYHGGVQFYLEVGQNVEPDVQARIETALAPYVAALDFDEEEYIEPEKNDPNQLSLIGKVEHVPESEMTETPYVDWAGRTVALWHKPTSTLYVAPETYHHGDLAEVLYKRMGEQPDTTPMAYWLKDFVPAEYENDRWEIFGYGEVDRAMVDALLEVFPAPVFGPWDQSSRSWPRIAAEELAFKIEAVDGDYSWDDDRLPWVYRLSDNTLYVADWGSMHKPIFRAMGESVEHGESVTTEQLIPGFTLIDGSWEDIDTNSEWGEEVAAAYARIRTSLDQFSAAEAEHHREFLEGWSDDSPSMTEEEYDNRKTAQAEFEYGRPRESSVHTSEKNPLMDEIHDDAYPFVWVEGDIWIGRDTDGGHSDMMVDRPELFKKLRTMMRGRTWMQDRDGTDVYVGRITPDGRVEEWQLREVPENVQQQLRASLLSTRSVIGHTAAIEYVEPPRDGYGGENADDTYTMIYLPETDTLVVSTTPGVSHRSLLRFLDHEAHKQESNWRNIGMGFGWIFYSGVHNPDDETLPYADVDFTGVRIPEDYMREAAKHIISGGRTSRTAAVREVGIEGESQYDWRWGDQVRPVLALNGDIYLGSPTYHHRDLFRAMMVDAPGDREDWHDVRYATLITQPGELPRFGVSNTLTKEEQRELLDYLNSRTAASEELIETTIEEMREQGMVRVPFIINNQGRVYMGVPGGEHADIEPLDAAGAQGAVNFTMDDPPKLIAPTSYSGSDGFYTHLIDEEQAEQIVNMAAEEMYEYGVTDFWLRSSSAVYEDRDRRAELGARPVVLLYGGERLVGEPTQSHGDILDAHGLAMHEPRDFGVIYPDGSEWWLEDIASDSLSPNTAAITSNVMYHVAPIEDRAMIQEMGLDYTRRTRDLWEDYFDDYPVPERGTDEYPDGNYLWDNMESAQIYVDQFGNVEQEMDVWQVDATGLELEEDPQLYNSYFTPDAIGPERMRLLNSSNRIEGNTMASSDERSSHSSHRATQNTPNTLPPPSPSVRQVSRLITSSPVSQGFKLGLDGEVPERNRWILLKDGTLITDEDMPVDKHTDLARRHGIPWRDVADLGYGQTSLSQLPECKDWYANSWAELVEPELDSSNSREGTTHGGSTYTARGYQGCPPRVPPAYTGKHLFGNDSISDFSGEWTVVPVENGKVFQGDNPHTNGQYPLWYSYTLKTIWVGESGTHHGQLGKVLRSQGINMKDPMTSYGIWFLNGEEGDQPNGGANYWMPDDIEAALRKHFSPSLTNHSGAAAKGKVNLVTLDVEQSDSMHDAWVYDEDTNTLYYGAAEWEVHVLDNREESKHQVPWANDRRPVLYDKDSRRIWIGSPGTHHTPLAQAMEKAGFDRNDATNWDIIYPNGEVRMELRFEPGSQEAVNTALGTSYEPPSTGTTERDPIFSAQIFSDFTDTSDTSFGKVCPVTAAEDDPGQIQLRDIKRYYGAVYDEDGEERDGDYGDWHDESEEEEFGEPSSAVPKFQPGEYVVFRGNQGGGTVLEVEQFEGGWWYQVENYAGQTVQAPEEACVRPEGYDEPATLTLEDFGIPPSAEEYYRTATVQIVEVPNSNAVRPQPRGDYGQRAFGWDASTNTLYVSDWHGDILKYLKSNEVHAYNWGQSGEDKPWAFGTYSAGPNEGGQGVVRWLYDMFQDEPHGIEPTPEIRAFVEDYFRENEGKVANIVGTPGAENIWESDQCALYQNGTLYLSEGTMATHPEIIRHYGLDRNEPMLPMWSNEGEREVTIMSWEESVDRSLASQALPLIKQVWPDYRVMNLNSDGEWREVVAAHHPADDVTDWEYSGTWIYNPSVGVILGWDASTHGDLLEDEGINWNDAKGWPMGWLFTGLEGTDGEDRTAVIPVSVEFGNFDMEMMETAKAEMIREGFQWVLPEDAEGMFQFDQPVYDPKKFTAVGDSPKLNYEWQHATINGVAVHWIDAGYDDTHAIVFEPEKNAVWIALHGHHIDIFHEDRNLMNVSNFFFDVDINGKVQNDIGGGFREFAPQPNERIISFIQKIFDGVAQDYMKSSANLNPKFEVIETEIREGYNPDTMPFVYLGRNNTVYVATEDCGHPRLMAKLGLPMSRNDMFYHEDLVAGEIDAGDGGVDLLYYGNDEEGDKLALAVKEAVGIWFMENADTYARETVERTSATIRELDTGSNEVHVEEMMGMRPIIYVPEEDSIYVGNAGAFHGDLLKSLVGPDRESWQHTRSWPKGIINMNNKVTWYGSGAGEAEGQVEEWLVNSKIARRQSTEVEVIEKVEEDNSAYDRTLRKPFIYSPSTDQLFIGPYGAHHHELIFDAFKLNGTTPEDWATEEYGAREMIAMTIEDDPGNLGIILEDKNAIYYWGEPRDEAVAVMKQTYPAYTQGVNGWEEDDLLYDPASHVVSSDVGRTKFVEVPSRNSNHSDVPFVWDSRDNTVYVTHGYGFHADVVIYLDSDLGVWPTNDPLAIMGLGEWSWFDPMGDDSVENPGVYYLSDYSLEIPPEVKAQIEEWFATNAPETEGGFKALGAGRDYRNIARDPFEGKGTRTLMMGDTDKEYPDPRGTFVYVDGELWFGDTIHPRILSYIIGERGESPGDWRKFLTEHEVAFGRFFYPGEFLHFRGGDAVTFDGDVPEAWFESGDFGPGTPDVNAKALEALRRFLPGVVEE